MQRVHLFYDIIRFRIPAFMTISFAQGYTDLHMESYESISCLRLMIMSRKLWSCKALSLSWREWWVAQFTYASYGIKVYIFQNAEKILFKFCWAYLVSLLSEHTCFCSFMYKNYVRLYFEQKKHTFLIMIIKSNNQAKLCTFILNQLWDDQLKIIGYESAIEKNIVCNNADNAILLLRSGRSFLSPLSYSTLLGAAAFYSNPSIRSNPSYQRPFGSQSNHDLCIFLVEQCGAKNYNWGLINAAYSNNLKLCRYFVLKGADNYEEAAIKSSDLEVVEYLRSRFIPHI